jgi:hypothetical protein
MNIARIRLTRLQTTWRRCTALAAVYGCVVALAGCQLGGALRPTDRSHDMPAANAVSSPLYVYLETMNGLASADPAKQADVFFEVEQDYTRAPTTANTLRYAVALATPAHPSTRPNEGKRLLETLLATPERLTQEERTFAAVLLHETNVRLKLEAENRRLLETLDDRIRSQANSDKRVQAQLEENSRLRRALAEAQQKLDAIKEIERSIIERSSTPPGNRDSAALPSETQGSPAGR